MRGLLAALFLLVYGYANACDWTAGVGQSRRLTDGKTGAVGSVACLINEKWDLRLNYFGEQRIYEDTLVIKPYATISASRVWLFRDGRNFRPLLSVGIALKEAARCHYNGDVNCNRLTPLSFCFLTRAGFHIGDLVVSLNHCSNAGFDYGPEKKNLGQDFVLVELHF